MNSISSWLCANSSKSLYVKIVHPGGHVELHDRPILAAELLSRNPKCCVAHATVFQHPYAVVSPETTLSLGQKYYVVPMGTIKKLQLKHPRVRDAIHNNDDDETGSSSFCWLFRNSKNRSLGLGIKLRDSRIDRKRDCDDSSSSAKAGNGGSSSSPATGRISLFSMDNWQPAGLRSIVED